MTTPTHERLPGLDIETTLPSVAAFAPEVKVRVTFSDKDPVLGNAELLALYDKYALFVASCVAVTARTFFGLLAAPMTGRVGVKQENAEGYMKSVSKMAANATAEATLDAMAATAPKPIADLIATLSATGMRGLDILRALNLQETPE